VLSLDEEEKLLHNAAPFMQDLIVFGLNTGLRVGEIFSLRWSNVDMDQNVLNVFAHKTWKTRTVPMNQKCVRLSKHGLYTGKTSWSSTTRVPANPSWISKEALDLRAKRRELQA